MKLLEVFPKKDVSWIRRNSSYLSTNTTSKTWQSTSRWKQHSAIFELWL